MVNGRFVWFLEKHNMLSFSMWKYGILKEIFDMGLKRRLPLFLSIFCVSERHFNVGANSTFSEEKEQEMGVPQGSILSVTLFSIKIKSLAIVLKDEFDTMPCV